MVINNETKNRWPQKKDKNPQKKDKNPPKKVYAKIQDRGSASEPKQKMRNPTHDEIGQNPRKGENEK